MRDDSNHILDDLLREWHERSDDHQLVAGITPQPMFRWAVTSRGWDRTDDIHEDKASKIKLDAIDFHVWELTPLHRAAIHAHARNLSCRVAVWGNPILPRCAMERAALLGEAKVKLLARLVAAGVI